MPCIALAERQCAGGAGANSPLSLLLQSDSLNLSSLESGYLSRTVEQRNAANITGSIAVEKKS
jgi:hypothetical protein